MVFEIILAVIIAAQFFYLLKRINDMAALDDLKIIINDLDKSADSIITLLQNLKTQLGDSVLAADVEAEVVKLQAIKTKIDTAKQ